MQPTKAEWEEIAAMLDRLWSPVYLRCDGYLVRAALERITASRLGIVVAVNGWQYKGAWMMDDWEAHEEPKRFWRPVKHQRMKAKELKIWERAFGKSHCRAKGYYDPIIMPTPFWLRPRPLIAHLRKHNQLIQVIDYATYAAELEALRQLEVNPGVDSTHALA